MEAIRNSVTQSDIDQESRRSHRQDHQHSKMKALELDNAATEGATDDEKRIPYHAVIKESLLLTDNEVTISFLKFMIGVAILNFPAQASHFGIINGFVSTILIVAFILKSNENLVKAIPLDLMNQNLTLGQIAGAIFGHQSYNDVVDAVIVLCQGCNYILYLKYVGAQLNLVVCQETDNQFCGQSNTFLMYYYVPVSLIVLFISQLKNYKQVSYIAKLAMIATFVAILAIICDSIIQILVYVKIDYSSSESTDGNQEFQQSSLQIQYQQNYQTRNIQVLMPIYPFFLDCFCKIPVSFEGAPIVPRLYTHAKNKHFFVRNLNRAVLALGVLQLIFGTLCVFAYGNKLQEIILMNITYGLFSNFIKLLYAFGMVINLVMQLIPILEIAECRQPSIFGNDINANSMQQPEGQNMHAYIFDPNKRSFKQMVTKFFNTLFLVSLFLFLTMALQDFHLLLLIDGAILANVLMLLLPNALYLYQVNYGYLKYRESPKNYILACFMFYLSIFIIIYTTFRGIQTGMGTLNVNRIIN